MCFLGAFAQETLIIHTASGGVRSIPFTQKPELYFDETDVVKVMVSGSIERYSFSNIEQITFGEGIAEFKGDANWDGRVNVADIVAIINARKGNPPAGYNAENANADGKGEVDEGDIKAIVNIIMEKKE